MIVNRKIAPPINNVDHIEYHYPEHIILPGGTNLFVMNGGEQEVVKLDFSMKAGSWYEQNKLESLMTANMLTEGTSSMKASEIADRIDFYGAQFSSIPYYDNNYISLVTLKRHLPQLLPIIADMLRDSIFPENEFEIVRQKRIQRALVDAERVGLMAQRRFLREMFGESHPYSPVASPDAYKIVTREGVKIHYQHNYGSERMNIVGSGQVDDEVKSLIINSFGEKWGGSANPQNNVPIIQPNSNNYIFIEKPGANQNAMTIGKLFPIQHHPDMPGIKVLVTIFGGYFGSRLMTNLREEKGLTYSIHASAISFIHQGIFMVHAEVAADKTEEAIKEVFREMEKLREEPVPEEELQPLRNYMLGRILEEFDGPFARAQSFSSLQDAGLDFSYFDRMIETIRTITPLKIQELARKYLDPATMTTVVAGLKEQ
jgi:zinc protease